jgi:hypothetical protein
MPVLVETQAYCEWATRAIGYPDRILLAAWELRCLAKLFRFVGKNLEKPCGYFSRTFRQ